jgi:N-acyl-D-aspartate/D-glutamate deacylase
VQSLTEGSYGLSTGLMYSPGCFSDSDEISHFARLLSHYPNTLYSSHLRGYSETLVESVGEFLNTISSAGIPGEISHLASYGAKNAPSIERALQGIMDCNREGGRVEYDVLPYCSGSTTLMAIIPPWEYEKGTADFIGKIRDDEHLDRMFEEMNRFVPQWPIWENRYWGDNFVRNCGWQNIYVVGLEHNTDLVGLNFVEIAEKRKTSVSRCLRDLLIDENCNIIVLMTDDIGGCIGKHPIYLDMMLENPLSNVCTDALFQQNGRSMASTYGAFPRFIRRYVSERKVLTLEDAIHKLTQKVASKFGITDRGTLQEGVQADVIVFDASEFRDHPLVGARSYTEEPRLATGIDYLLINGEIVLENGKYYGDKRPGKVLRRS